MANNFTDIPDFARPPFEGFPEEGIKFLAGLAKNNDKAWFQARKELYQEKVLFPAQLFVNALGERLRADFPKIRFDPRAHGGGSLMRIYRDVRFSKDKTPYAPRVGALWWEGEGKPRQNPGFFVRINGEGAWMAGGRYIFPKPALERYRLWLDDDKKAAELDKIITGIEASGVGDGLRGDAYKRVPKPYTEDHPRADLLKRKGLFIATPDIPIDIVTSAELLDVCAARARALKPLHQWLVRLLAAS